MLETELEAALNLACETVTQKDERDMSVGYKRRKMTATKFVKDSITKPNDDKSVTLEEVNRRTRSDEVTFPFIDLAFKTSRDIILEQISESVESDSGLVKCIKSATAFGPEIDIKTVDKEDFVTCNGSANEQSHGRVTECCLTTFLDVIMSEKFSELCSFLIENFPGSKTDRLFDLSHISSMMKKNMYECSPELFCSDIQQIWEKLLLVGTDMANFAKCLSDQTSIAFHEKHFQAGSSSHISPERTRHEEVNMQQTEISPLKDVLFCRECGDKSDGSNRLVCDSCEGLYHISCIVPRIKVIPSASWYCANCSTKSFH